MKCRRRFDMILMVFNQFFPQNTCSTQVPNQQRYNVIGLQLVPKTWRFKKFVLGLMSDMKTRLPLSSNGDNEQTNPDLLTVTVTIHPLFPAMLWHKGEPANNCYVTYLHLTPQYLNSKCIAKDRWCQNDPVASINRIGSISFIDHLMLSQDTLFYSRGIHDM